MTLIEVLVAFVVLSVTLSVIMQIFSGGLRNARTADAYSRAVFLAESKLAAAGVEQKLVVGESSGEVGKDLRWRVAVSPIEDGGEPMTPVRLYEVRAQVIWSDDGRERRIELISLRVEPSS